ncbi:MAG: response regulator [Granulosicoccus sp.]
MSPSDSSECVTILHVEDNPADVYLIKRGLRGSAVSLDIVNLVDGEETMEYLCRCASGELPLPDMVLLDINLPKVNGHDLLVWMRSVQVLQSIPVFMLTSSSSRQDREKMFRNGGQAFFTKPYTLEERSTIVRSIENFLSGLPLDQTAIQNANA